MPRVHLDRYHHVKVNEAKNKTALLLRTTLLMHPEKLYKSKATDAKDTDEAFMYITLAFSRYVLCLTPDSTHMWHFKLKKAYHPDFHCAVKSNKWNPCGHSHALEMPLCKEEVIVHNCSNVIWTWESQMRARHLPLWQIAVTGGKQRKEWGRTHLIGNVRAWLD